MFFYRLRMTWTTDGGGSSLPIRELSSFIGLTRRIGIGDPFYTRGADTFINKLHEGDIVLVLAQGSTPLVLTRIADDEVMDHTAIPEAGFPNLDDWLKKVRNVDILGWYYNVQNTIPPVEDSRSWGPSTFASINVTEPLKFTTKWYNEIMKTNIPINNQIIEEKINLLCNVKNLILTGAPGTGKSFLAKEIAYKLTGDTEGNSPHIGFCQFHPSYDYTDFVEGLRPTQPKDDGSILFERKDGVFMDFCRKAIKGSFFNTTDNFEESWQKLVDFLNDEDFIPITTLNGRSTFDVELNAYGTGLASHTYKSEKDRENGKAVPRHSKYFNHDQLYRIYRGLPGVPNGGHDNYRRAIIDLMKSRFGLKDYREGLQVDATKYSQKYVFIIDEINRGDIAKIFGELFYAIEPDYRGKKGSVKTQYANLNQDDDFFKDGFYIPENVYIIGTMNDIDRNVESMDFAIRRRFTWDEITPEETVDMLYEQKKGILEFAETAEKCMSAINEQIKQTDGLDAAYQLGAAYFLKLKDFNGDSKQRFNQLWNYNIAPLLKEYLRSMPKAEEALKKLHEVWGKSISNADTAITPQSGTNGNNSADEQQ